MVITSPYSDRTSPSQANQCLFSHFLASLGPQEKTDCASMLWSIDSCQNRVSTDQYPWPYRGLRCRPSRSSIFWSYPLTSHYFLNDRRLKLIFFFNFIWTMLCLCHHGSLLLKFWFHTELGRENSSSYLKIQAGKTFSYHSHALVTLYVQFLYSDWSKFDRRVHAKNLGSIFKLVYFDSLSWQCFVSTCGVLKCFFFFFSLDIQNEIQLLSRVFCYSWLVCLLGFWLRKVSLVKVGNPISDGIVFVFHLTWCVLKEGLKVSSDTGLTWYLSGAGSRMLSLSNYCIWCFFCLFVCFFSFILLHEVEHSLCGKFIHVCKIWGNDLTEY